MVSQGRFELPTFPLGGAKLSLRASRPDFLRVIKDIISYKHSQKALRPPGVAVAMGLNR
ncbi:hypothetical protein D3C84_433420 [compost metagenome]